MKIVKSAIDFLGYDVVKASFARERTVVSPFFKITIRQCQQILNNGCFWVSHLNIISSISFRIFSFTKLSFLSRLIIKFTDNRCVSILWRLKTKRIKQLQVRS